MKTINAEWISVKNELPDDGVPVRAYADNRTVFPYAFLKNGTWCYRNMPDDTGWNWIDHNSGHDCNIIYWTHLPESPEE